MKEPDYYGDYKDPRPYPHKHLDCDNPKTWPSAWKAFPCIDADSGTHLVRRQAYRVGREGSILLPLGRVGG